MCVYVCVYVYRYVCVYVCVCTRKKMITMKEIILHRSCSIDCLCMCIYVLYGIKDACLSVIGFYDPFLLKRPSQQTSQWLSQQPSQKNKKARFSCASRISLMLFMRRKARASLTSHRIIRTMRIYLASHRISHMRAHMRAFINTGNNNPLVA